MAINSKVEICQMALNHLGAYGPINDIDRPVSSVEGVFSLWYDITRQELLKQLIPNFAMQRRVVAKLVETPAFGYQNVYEYPADCLRVLGLGDIYLKANDYNVENNRIYTHYDYENGAELRFIGDVTDVTRFSPEFKTLLALALAKNAALPITQDATRLRLVSQMYDAKIGAASAVNGQENRPIRISDSRYRASRYGGGVVEKR